MSQPNDKPLHDWVRQSLQTYRPDYEPTDWERMQRTLRRRWRGKAIGGGTLLLLLGLLWWGWPDRTPTRQLIAGHGVTPPPHPSQYSSLPGTEDRTVSAIRPVPGLKKAGRLVYKPRIVSDRLPAQRPIRPGQLMNRLPSMVAIKSLPTALTSQIPVRHPIAFSSEEAAIARQLQTGNFGSDSTSYRILERHISQWPDAVLVCDLTTSMYPYTTQLFAWFRKYGRNHSTKGVVLFTDCDSLGQQTFPGGPPGQMFIIREGPTARTLPILLEAARNTVRNTDDSENNVEALLVAQAEFPAAKHLILVADNLSRVKDMSRLGGVRKPVHVVLCGTTGSDITLAYQTDYEVIARQTQGSLHTLEDDINPGALASDQTLRVGTRFYRYQPRRKQFKLTPFDHRPKRFLKFIWL